MASINPNLTLGYKKVDDFEIPMDIYLPKNKKNAPVLLWFHGGGLLQGQRDMIAPHMKRAVQTYGLVVISADYRLAPQVSVHEIAKDVQDCVEFIRTRLAYHLPENTVDTKHLAISGSSAGGYLALNAGLDLDLKPQVIVPIYPITDPVGAFFIKSRTPPKGSDSTTRDTHSLSRYIDFSGSVQTSSSPTSDRRHMYAYMMRTASLAQLWGLVPGDELDIPNWQISRQFNPNLYPPTYIVHGTADTAVGVEQSDEVVGALVGCGIETVYERLLGKDHGFDEDENYDNPALYEFVMKHISKDN